MQDISNLPIPENYPSIEAWAYSLIFQLETPKQVEFTQLPTYTIDNLPSPNQDGLMVFVTDDVGGAVPAFSSGNKWLRVTDRAEVSTT